jgi:hypothetical protein
MVYSLQSENSRNRERENRFHLNVILARTAGEEKILPISFQNLFHKGFIFS